MAATQDAPPEDDTSQVPAAPDVKAPQRRMSTRQVLACLVVAGILLLLVEGAEIRDSGEEMSHGVKRSLVLAVGKPAGYLADRLPFASANERLRTWLSPDDGDLGGTADGASPAALELRGSIAPVTPDALDPAALGEQPVKLPKLTKLLVTGDSMSQPLDVELARRLADKGVKTVRDAHIGTGISKTDLLDWNQEAPLQARKDAAEAEVIFIGANEGFPMPVAGKDVDCCGAVWTAEYATRVRLMMDAYRRAGKSRVYWLLLPLPRDPARQKIARAVNQAVRVAAEPYRTQVRILDMSAIFTPGGKYRSAMDVGGRETLVREPDGIHLNEQGAKIAADAVQRALAADFAS